jgi:hypothetical protein
VLVIRIPNIIGRLTKPEYFWCKIRITLILKHVLNDNSGPRELSGSHIRINGVLKSVITMTI